MPRHHGPVRAIPRAAPLPIRRPSPRPGAFPTGIRRTGTSSSAKRTSRTGRFSPPARSRRRTLNGAARHRRGRPPEVLTLLPRGAPGIGASGRAGDAPLPAAAPRNVPGRIVVPGIRSRSPAAHAPLLLPFPLADLLLGVPSGSVSSRKTLSILGLAVSWLTWTKYA